MKVITIAGRTGKPAEIRRTQDGTPVLAFSVAVDEGYGRDKGTLWFDCSLFGKRGEAIADMLPKGKEVTVTGDFGTREYNGKTYFTVRVNDVKLHGGKGDSQSASNVQQLRPQQNGGAADFDDTIPFAPEWR